MSKTRIYKKGGLEEGFFQIDKVAATFKLTFIYINSSVGILNGGNFGCQGGDKLLIMFDDNSVLKLNLNGPFYGCRTESAGLGTKMLLGSYATFATSNKVLFEPEYHITLSDLDLLMDKKIIKIRIEATGTKAVTHQKLNNLDLIIAEEDASQFQKDVICILN